MRFQATRMVLMAGLFAAACGGCGLILGIKEVSGDGLGGGGSGGATSSSETSSSTTSASSSTSSSTTSSTSGGCSLEDCNGFCTDTAKDPENCGACGHSCNGGDCQNGQCTIVDLASSQTGAKGIAVDPDAIFYLATNGVLRLDRKASSKPSLIAPTTNAVALNTALDKTNAYWIESAGSTSLIHTVPKIGGTIATIATQQNDPLGVAVSPTDVYWTNANTVVTAPKTAMSSTGTVFASGTGPVGIAIDATDVYWTEVSSAMVWKRPLAGGSATMLDSSQTGAWGIALGSGFVCWVAQTDGNVMMVPTGGGKHVTIASAQQKPTYIAAVGNDVYWTADDGVWKATVGSGAPTLIAKQQTATSIAADAAGVYWTTTDGFVRFLAE
jgi:hypothetical protein